MIKLENQSESTLELLLLHKYSLLCWSKSKKNNNQFYVVIAKFVEMRVSTFIIFMYLYFLVQVLGEGGEVKGRNLLQNAMSE